MCETIGAFLHKAVPLDIHSSIECAGTTIFRRPVTFCYVFFRVFATVCVTGILGLYIYDEITKNDGYNNLNHLFFDLCDLTFWGLLSALIYLWSVTIFSIRVFLGIRRETRYDLSDLGRYPSITQLNMRLAWNYTIFFMNLTLSGAIFAVFGYFAINYYLNDKIINISKDDDIETLIYKLCIHGAAAISVLIEWLTSCWQLTYRGALFPFLAAIMWIVVSVLFWISGCKNKNGERFIYEQVDWGHKPLEAVIFCGTGSLLLAVTHFILVFVKNQVLNCWIRSRVNNEIALLVISNNYNSKRNVNVHADIDDFDNI